MRLDYQGGTGVFRVFQSTHPRGVRPVLQLRSGMDVSISIHAPTWGATSSTNTSKLTTVFQSTHPRGVRLTVRACSAALSNFNPRTHVGCDNAKVLQISVIAISIHAPTWGATKSLKKNKVMRINFNPRTHVGCDMDVTYLTGMIYISIHAPTWGATVKPSNGWLLGHKDNEFANENIIIINSVNIT